MNEDLKKLRKLCEYDDRVNTLDAGLIRPLDEAGFSRFLQHTSNVSPDKDNHEVTVGRPFFIISAYLSNRPLKINKDKSRELIDDIKNAGYGGFQLIGHWTDKRDGKLVESEERSFLVPYREGRQSVEDFIDLGRELTRKYEQDALCYSDGGNAYLYEPFEKPNTRKLGSRVNLTTANLYQAYSTAKHHDVRFQNYGDVPDKPNLDKETESVSLEGFSIPNCWSCAMTMENAGLLWSDYGYDLRGTNS